MHVAVPGVTGPRDIVSVSMPEQISPGQLFPICGIPWIEVIYAHKLIFFIIFIVRQISGHPVSGRTAASRLGQRAINSDRRRTRAACDHQRSRRDRWASYTCPLSTESILRTWSASWSRMGRWPKHGTRTRVPFADRTRRRAAGLPPPVRRHAPRLSNTPAAPDERGRLTTAAPCAAPDVFRGKPRADHFDSPPRASTGSSARPV